MQYNPVGWFEIPVKDMQRARKFYEGVFEMKLTDMKMEGHEMFAFPMDPKVSGAGGSLVKGDGYEPSMGGTVVYFTSPMFDQTIERAQKMGARIIVPKKNIGDYGWTCWLGDTEGNTIALHTMK